MFLADAEEWFLQSSFEGALVFGVERPSVAFFTGRACSTACSNTVFATLHLEGRNDVRVTFTYS